MLSIPLKAFRAQQKNQPQECPLKISLSIIPTAQEVKSSPAEAHIASLTCGALSPCPLTFIEVEQVGGRAEDI